MADSEAAPSPGHLTTNVSDVQQLPHSRISSSVVYLIHSLGKEESCMNSLWRPLESREPRGLPPSLTAVLLDPWFTESLLRVALLQDTDGHTGPGGNSCTSCHKPMTMALPLPRTILGHHNQTSRDSLTFLAKPFLNPQCRYLSGPSLCHLTAVNEGWFPSNPAMVHCLATVWPLQINSMKGTMKDQFQHSMTARLPTAHSFSKVFLWSWEIISPSKKPNMPFLVLHNYNQFPLKEISKNVFKMCCFLRKYSGLESSEVRDTLNFFFLKQNGFSLADTHIAQKWSRTEKLWFSPPKWLHERHLVLAKRGSPIAVFTMG